MANQITRRQFLHYTLVSSGLIILNSFTNSLASEPDNSQLTQDTNPNLEIILKSDKEIYKSKDLRKHWQNYPIIDVNIFNRSDNPIWLVRALDGSDVKWRYPHCYLEVFNSKGNNVKILSWGRCGNMNSILEGDFVQVHPNKGFNPYINPIRLDFDIENPDTYKVIFNYSTQSTDDKQWLGDLGENYTKLIPLVPKNILLKKEISIIVK